MRFSDRLKEGSKKVVEKTVKGTRDWSHKINEKDRSLKENTGKGLVHTTGDRIGDLTGKVVGKPIEALGDKVNSHFVSDLGKGFHRSIHFTGDLGGQVGQGTFKTVQGMVQRNGRETKEGLSEIGNATGRTLKGIGKTAVYTVSNSGKIISGLYRKDYEQVKVSAGAVAKVVIIGGATFTVIDLLDGGDIANAEDGAFIHTHNSHLIDQTHPETGVSFEAQTVQLEDGTEVVGVFPQFEPVATVDLPSDLYESSDYLHFSYANVELVEAVSQNPELAMQFSIDQLEQIYAGETPDGYTWHHHEQLGRLELVDEEIHAKTGHSGGRSIWGGGSDAR